MERSDYREQKKRKAKEGDDICIGPFIMDKFGYLHCDIMFLELEHCN
jgi:hypothetical protein